MLENGLYKKTDTTILLYAHPIYDQEGLLQDNIQSNFVSMMGCTNSLNNGPTGTSSSTISMYQKNTLINNMSNRYLSFDFHSD